MAHLHCLGLLHQLSPWSAAVAKWSRRYAFVYVWCFLRMVQFIRPGSPLTMNGDCFVRHRFMQPGNLGRSREHAESGLLLLGRAYRISLCGRPTGMHARLRSRHRAALGRMWIRTGCAVQWANDRLDCAANDFHAPLLRSHIYFMFGNRTRNSAVSR